MKGKKLNTIRTMQWIVDRTMVDNNGCWNWIRFRDKDGYGKTDTGIITSYTPSKGQRDRLKGRYACVAAHRLSFFLSYGYDPVIVRHMCNNPACCNPEHLLGGDEVDNLLDRYLNRITTRLVTLHGWTYSEVARLISD